MGWSGGTFTRTNGTYNGSTVWAQDRDASVKITAAHHDTHDQDLATGINACVAKDGSNTLTLLNLSGTVNASSGIIKVGSVTLASTYGTNNAFYGGAGNFALAGTDCVGMGYLALFALTSGNSNTAIGSLAAITLSSGSHNTAVGYVALNTATTGSGNTAVGDTALALVAAGSNNVGVGYAAGNNVTSAGKCVAVGYNAQPPSATADGGMSIQNAIYGTGNTGSGTSVSAGNLGLYTKAPTARLHLPAGTSTANTAPLKLTAGTNLGTPEDGAIEFDGTHVYITISGSRKTFTVT